MRRRLGFTLLELMTSVALTTIVGLATFTLLTDVLAVHRSAESSADAAEGLRRVAALLARDVRCATAANARPDGIETGDAFWLLRDDTLVRRSGETSVVVLRKVARFDVASTPDGFLATLEMRPARGEPRGPATTMRLRPRAERQR